MELLVIYVILVVIVAVAAGNRGRSAAGWGLLALVISPLLAGLGLLLVGPKMPSGPGVGFADELTKLVALRDAGVIAEEDYARERARLLPPTDQAGPGMRCGRCTRNLSPVWKGKCQHCGAAYAEYPPVRA